MPLFRSYRAVLICVSLTFLGACSSATGEAEETSLDRSSGSTSGLSSGDTGSSSSGSYDTSATEPDLGETHGNDGDFVYDSSSARRILLQGDSITIEGTGAVASGSQATITEPGTYEVSGTLHNGQIVVNASTDGLVQLVLNGADITNQSSAPIYVIQASTTAIILHEGTNNIITDASTYVYAGSDEDEPDAAIFSKDDLSIGGNGSLVVHANYQDGIASKDGLIIASGDITVQASDDGIRGKDYLIVEGGLLDIEAGGDGLKSTQDSDATLGYVAIRGGRLDIAAGADGIQGETLVAVSGGELKIVTAGGSSGTLADDASAKGIKAGSHVLITGGTLDINSADDAIHSNAHITISGGTMILSSGDDGVHSDTSLTLRGGNIQITKSYEGLESARIVIHEGTVRVTSSDDGINVAGGSGSTMPGGGGRPGQNTGNTGSTTDSLIIHGGYLAVNAGGDGIDVNGSWLMTGGTVLVHGPTDNGNGATDYDGNFIITGGTLIAAGSSGMAQAPGTSSTQSSVLIKFSTTRSAGTLFHMAYGNEESLTFQPAKNYQSIVISTPDMAAGKTYKLYSGGSHSGTVQDGLWSGGVYTAGTQLQDLTLNSIVSNVNR